jgi:hypothetical protein
MKEKLTKIFKNILDEIGDPLYRVDVLIKNASLLDKDTESDRVQELVGEAVKIVLKEKNIGSAKRLLDYLIQSGQLDEAANIVKPQLLFHKKPNPAKNIDQRTGYCVKILKRSKEINNIEDTIKLATNLFSYCKNDSFFSFDTYVQFVFEVIKLKSEVNSSQQKEKVSELVVDVIKSGLFTDFLNLKLIQRLEESGEYNSIITVEKESKIDIESFTDLILICRYAEDGKYDDALNLLNMYLTKDHFSHILKHEDGRALELTIYLLFHLDYFARAMRSTSDSEDEDAKEIYEVMNGFIQQYLESIGNLDPFDYYNQIELVGQLVGSIFHNLIIVIPDEANRLLDNIVKNSSQSNYHIFLYHVYNGMGNKAKADKWLRKYRSAIDYKEKEADLLTKHAIANDLLEHLFKRREYSECCNVLQDYEKYVLPEVVKEDDEDITYKDMYGFFGTDDYFFHETLSNVVQSETDAETIISKFKDDRIRDIGYIHLAAKAFQESKLTSAFSYLQKLQSAPVGYAIIMLGDELFK